MKNYYRVMLGQSSSLASDCFSGGFIGADFGIQEDLTGRLPEWLRFFNREFVPIYQAAHPDVPKIGAGLCCGFLWTIAKGILRGDFVLSPDGTGSFRVGEVTSDYFYRPGQVLPHRRQVRWLSQVIAGSDMSDALRKSANYRGTVCAVTRHGDEIDRLISQRQVDARNGSNQSAEDAGSFMMEKHLESFLVENWQQTELGRNYDLYEEDGEIVGQQYPSDTGPIDLLAVSKDGKKLLVVELKRGRASDAVVGQIARYMGYVKEEIAEDHQSVEGAIIALDDDQRVRRALSVLPNVRFYRYQISFKLTPA